MLFLLSEVRNEKKKKKSYVFKTISSLFSSPDFTRSDACIDANKATVDILHVRLSRGLSRLPSKQGHNINIRYTCYSNHTRRTICIHDVKRLCIIILCYTTSLWCVMTHCRCVSISGNSNNITIPS